jgi:platelet-activating factor acetylhydrolase IB subunit beta/gamma
MCLKNQIAQLSASFFLLVSRSSAAPFEYPWGPWNSGLMDPQPHGWPLTAEERAYVVQKPEFERRPGRESFKHLPKLWPVIPTAGHWGGSSWLDTHEKLVRYVEKHAGDCDVLLVGDSITQQWGGPLDTGVLNAAWQQRFSELKTVNIGVGGDKTQNVLWRLDHGGAAGLQPKVILLMIGNNNMFFTPETGVEAAAQGIQMCASNLRGKFPAAQIVVAKILPAHTPGHTFYEDIRRTNLALEQLQLEQDPRLRVLDLWADFTDDTGSLRSELFTADRIHLSPAGYAVYAKRLQPLLQAAVNGQPWP